MVDRRSLAIGVLAVLVAMSQVESGRAQGQARPRARCGSTKRSGCRSPRPRVPADAEPERRRVAEVAAGGEAGAFTPEPGAKDLKTVLFNWTWHMGMLRSGNESELSRRSTTTLRGARSR